MLSENFKAHNFWALLDEAEENASDVLAEKLELDETQKHVLRKRLPLVAGAIKALFFGAGPTVSDSLNRPTLLEDSIKS